MEAMESHLPHIPAEIVRQILLRLPVKSILRFKCVCKPWLSWTSDLKFRLSIERQQVIVRCAALNGWTLSLHSIDDEAASVKELPNPCNTKLFFGRIRIFGSCNGLLLLNLGSDLLLWNPLTRCYRKMLTYDRLLDAGYHIMSGLCCYDSSIDDYKVVIGLGYNQNRDYSENFVKVGSFKSTLKDVSFPYKILATTQGLVVNGQLHWLVNATGLHHIIIYFDPAKNEFGEVPIPQSKTVLGLGVLGGCLCMARRLFDENDDFDWGNVEVSMMMEYGVKESWTIVFVISNLTGIIHYGVLDRLEPLCFTKDGEILMLLGRRKILAYNPTERCWRNIPIPTNIDAAIYKELPDAVTYVQTLVSPNAWKTHDRERTKEEKQL